MSLAGMVGFIEERAGTWPVLEGKLPVEVCFAHKIAESSFTAHNFDRPVFWPVG
jgi:hypothetical protein